MSSEIKTNGNGTATVHDQHPEGRDAGCRPRHGPGLHRRVRQRHRPPGADRPLTGSSNGASTTRSIRRAFASTGGAGAATIAPCRSGVARTAGPRRRKALGAGSVAVDDDLCARASISVAASPAASGCAASTHGSRPSTGARSARAGRPPSRSRSRPTTARREAPDAVPSPCSRRIARRPGRSSRSTSSTRPGADPPSRPRPATRRRPRASSCPQGRCRRRDRTDGRCGATRIVDRRRAGDGQGQVTVVGSASTRSIGVPKSRFWPGFGAWSDDDPVAAGSGRCRADRW